MYKSTLTIFAQVLLLLSCNFQAVPLEIPQACDPANNGKVAEMEGFLIPPKEVYCTNLRGVPVTCDIELRKINGTASVRLEIEKGVGPNKFAQPMDRFSTDSITIRDNMGNKIVFANMLRVMGKMRTGPNLCFMTVHKIEKSEDKKR